MSGINVRDFVYEYITPYDGNGDFLVGATDRTKKLRDECLVLLKKERENGGVLDVDTETVSSITSHAAGYINKDLELIVGLQTDAPLKRAIKPYGGVRVVEQACQEYGYTLASDVKEVFTKYRKSHNDGIHQVYTPTMKKYRKSKLISGLPDNYARGRVIGDYRRLALYGADALIAAKKADKDAIDGMLTEADIRQREELHDQITALQEIKLMAESYGCDVSQPAQTAQEAVQWTYFAFLAAVKEQDGAAMSLGNVSTFFDIYIQKDLDAGTLTEEEAQELIDQFVLKLRIIRQLRPDAYNQLFAGDPTWTTEAIGGVFHDGQHKVTKTSFRFLQTLYNLGPAPEPNITILWSPSLPEGFKHFCSQVSIDTSSIQYENDDLMKEYSGCDDTGIACCVSQTEMGKSMQFFGARCNLAKAFLYALNQGKDEITGMDVVDGIEALSHADTLDYDEVMERFDLVVEELAKEYVNTMNVIHYIHDKYYYEKSQMAFIDTDVKRVMAFGIAGLSVVADSLSAIKYTKVQAQRNDDGITVDFSTEGDFPKYGNDDDRVDTIATTVVSKFMNELRKHKVYRDATPTLSVLTITSNVVYGKYTGSTPDGRKQGEAFAPGANPMHGRDSHGAIASLNSVAKIPFADCRDGISNTMSLIPQGLGSTPEERKENLTQLLDGYFSKGAQHININVLDRATLEDAMEHPENYPQLTIRVSGYAVNFVRLSKAHQLEVISRTFHGEV